MLRYLAIFLCGVEVFAADFLRPLLRCLEPPNVFFFTDITLQIHRGHLSTKTIVLCSIGQFKRGIKKVSEISDSHTAIM